MRKIDLRGIQLADYSAVVPRGSFDVSAAIAVVEPICSAVATDGMAAIREFSERFDHCVPEHFRVPQRAIDTALAEMDPALRAAITESIRRRRQVCEQVEAEPSWRSTELSPGAIVGQRIVPVDRVGLYVPGGLAPLASSVLMNVVPAQVAGVSSVAVSTPPQAEFGGLPHPTILAVCGLLGVDEVYAVGGAQAIAMFGYGVPGLCEPVNVITGPGNIYVAAAKRLLLGRVGIDAEAGPTEIAVLADDSARPDFVAADLISQAEHDPMAGAVLITASERFAKLVEEQVAAQLAVHPLVDRLRISLFGEQSGIVLVDDMEQGIAVANDYAAEHLEIQTENSREVAAQITSAGAVFIGEYSPVPLGDYSAGSTHVLPTGGASKFGSGLTVRSFSKVIQVIDYSADALAEIGEGIELFAQAERLPGHAEAIAVRTKND